MSNAPDGESLRRRIARGEIVLGTFLNLGSPVAAELAGNAGFDWLILDMEHGALTESGLLHMLHAVAGTPAEAVVRVEEGTRLRIGRAMDFGARALMVPRVDDAAQAQRIVSFVRYPPTGTRGVALPTRFAGYGRLGHADVATAHADVTLMIQVESAAAVEASAEVAALDGVDVLFVGPTDLSHDLGRPGDIASAEYRAAIGRVGRSARDAGKAAGVLLWTVDDIALYEDAGFSVYALGSDGGWVNAAARRQVGEFRDRLRG